MGDVADRHEVAMPVSLHGLPPRTILCRPATAILVDEKLESCRQGIRRDRLHAIEVESVPLKVIGPRRADVAEFPPVGIRILDCFGCDDRHGQDREPARSKDPAYLGDRPLVVLDVFEYVRRKNDVVSGGRKRKMLDVNSVVDAASVNVGCFVGTETSPQHIAKKRFRSEMQQPFGTAGSGLKYLAEDQILQTVSLERAATGTLSVLPCTGGRAKVSERPAISADGTFETGFAAIRQTEPWESDPIGCVPNLDPVRQALSPCGIPRRARAASLVAAHSHYGETGIW